VDAMKDEARKHHKMTGVAAEHELYRACQIIFGRDLTVSREFLEYIQMSGIKTAFRKKALEIHPDRVAFHGNRGGRKENHAFNLVQEAYEILTRYVEAREKGFRFTGLRPAVHPLRESQPVKSQSRQKRNGRKAFSSRKKAAGSQEDTAKTVWKERSYKTPLPRRRLLFGQYLYYTGHIAWKDLIQALIWQRRQRPRLGEIARKEGWLKTSDIGKVLRHSNPQQPFGRTAKVLGLITEAQLHSLVCRQKRMQKKFGEYFVERKMLNRQQLASLLANCRRHNARQLRPPIQTRRGK
jgi:hypothetical protein